MGGSDRFQLQAPIEGLAQGGIVRFLPRGEHLQLRINPAAAKSASLTIRASLLHIAQLEAGLSS